MRHKSAFLLVYCWAAIAALVLFSCSKKQEALQGAVITEIQGQVMLTDAAGKEREVAGTDLYTKAALLTPGMTLSTGKGAHADLQFATGFVMRAGPSTKVTLEGARIVLDDGFVRVSMNLRGGRLFSRSGRLTKASSISVTSPTAVAFVRGTEFLVKEEGGKTETLVSDGAVKVYDDEMKKEQVVETGGKASVDAGGDVAVSQMTEADKREVADIGSDIKSITEDGKARMQNILNTFEENKARIKDAFEEQKKANEALIEGQKEKDKETLDQQRRRDREELDRVRGAAGEGISDIKKQSPSSGMDSTKSELDKIRQQKTK